MQPITNSAAAIHPRPSAAPGDPSARPPKEEPQGYPKRDEFIPEEKLEPTPTGRYAPARDGQGRPGLSVDAPEEEPSAPDAPEEGKDPEGGKEEKCTVDTDRVDREIEGLKKEKAALEQRLRAEEDSKRARDLKQELARVEDELRQKDNDAYRKQHAVYCLA